MSDRPAPRDDPKEPRRGEGATPPFDREINTRAITQFGVWLVVGVVVVALLMWGMFDVFEKQQEKKDAPPSPLVDRSKPRLPPEPRLQVTAERDLAEYRAEEDRRVRAYGWVDEKSGVAHIPVESAMQILAEKGLPARGVPQVVGALPVPEPPVESRHP